MDRLDDVFWPDARALLDALEGTDGLVAQLRRLVSGMQVDAALPTEEPQFFADSQLALRLADDGGAEVVVDLRFPVSLPELRELVAVIASALSAFTSHGPPAEGAVTTDVELFQAGGDGEDSFVSWMSAHVIGEDVNFRCQGYEEEEAGTSGVQLMVNFYGSWLVARLPLPFSLWAFRDLGAAVAALAQGEWERTTFVDRSPHHLLSQLPFLSEDVEAYASALGPLSVPISAEMQGRVQVWAHTRAARLWQELPSHALAALGLERGRVSADLVEGVRSCAEPYDAADWSEPSRESVVGPSAVPQDAETDAVDVGTTAVVTPAAARPVNALPAATIGDEMTVPAESTAQSFAARRPHLIPVAASVAMLLGALGTHPYGFFQLLRVVVCVGAGVLVWCVLDWRERMPASQRTQADVLGVIAAGIAVLFNPVVPVMLQRSTWIPIDVLTAAVMTLTAIVLQRPAHR